MSFGEQNYLLVSPGVGRQQASMGKGWSKAGSGSPFRGGHHEDTHSARPPQPRVREGQVGTGASLYV